MGRQSVTNEELCTALLTNGTIKKTAEALNVSERTIYNIMSKGEFKRMYEYAQADILNGCVSVCRDKAVEAILCISEIMNDRTVNPQTRLLAAQSILKNAVSMYNVTEKMKETAEDKYYNVF